MNRVAKTYTIQSVAIIVLQTMLTSVFIWNRGEANALFMPLCVVALFQLVACLTYGFAWEQVSKTSKESLPSFYLIASGIRMFVGIMVVMCFLLLVDNKMSVRFFVITFLVYYFILLFYDTFYFVKIEKSIHQHE